jgi:hypothetical protein
MGEMEMEYALFFGAMALSYGVVHWVSNLRRGEDFTTSLSHGPALIVLLGGFVAFIGGGTWLIGVVFRALFGK